VSFHNVRK